MKVWLVTFQDIEEYDSNLYFGNEQDLVDVYERNPTIISYSYYEVTEELTFNGFIYQPKDK